MGAITSASGLVREMSWNSLILFRSMFHSSFRTGVLELEEQRSMMKGQGKNYVINLGDLTM